MKTPLLLRFLAHFLSRSDEREIVGDLTEQYRRRSDASGHWRARLWLTRQLVTLPFWLLGDRLDARGTPADTDRRTNGESFMTSRTQDLRLAIRSFLRAPAFTLITVLTLALGIAANTTIFSVVDGVLLEGLPFPEQEELVVITHQLPGVNIDRIGTASGIHFVYSEESRALEAVAAYRSGSVAMTGVGSPVRLVDAQVTGSLFETLGVGPALGRSFTAEEDRPGGPDVVILSHALWASRFASDPNVLGRTVELNGVTHEIIGVMPEDFEFPSPRTRVYEAAQLDPTSAGFGGFNYQGIARLAPGADIESAESDLTSLFPVTAERFVDITPELIETSGLSVDLLPLQEAVVGPIETALWILMGTVGFVLLIACANVGNLFLARAEGRQKEVSIRTAMGAGRADLFWQYTVESAVLAVASGLLGLGMAWAGLKLLIANAPAALPRLSAIEIDGSVLGFTALIALSAAFLFGALPMLKHAAAAPASALRDGSRGSTAGRGRSRGRQVLVASQVAFAMVLLVGSGLMLKSFDRLLEVELGFEPENVVTFRVSLPEQTYPDVESTARFHQTALDRIGAMPGVVSTGAATELPLAGDNRSMDPLNQQGRPTGPNEVPSVVSLKGVAPGYFETMGIEVVRGRVFERSDVTDRTATAVITEAVAERFWPGGEDPLGRRISQGLPGTGEWSTVIGVVKDTPEGFLTEEPTGMVYYSMAPVEGSNQFWVGRGLIYTVRAGIPMQELMTAIRRTIAELDPNLPISDTQLLETRVEDSRVQMAFTMLLLSLAAMTGLLLGAIGIYGVISYLTAMRTREIGVRLALGAEAASVRSMALRQD